MDRNENARKRYEHAKKLVAEGKSKLEATKEAGSSMGTWYKFEKLAAQPASKKVSKKPGKVKFIDLPQPSQPRVAIVLCDPDQIGSILRGLK